MSSPQRSLIQIDLKDFAPKEIGFLDISIFLEGGFILKEKSFRQQLENFDWTKYANQKVAMFKDKTIIIPQWSWMLIIQYLMDQNSMGFVGNISEVTRLVTLETIAQIDVEKYKNQRVLIKGCGDFIDFTAGFVALTHKLIPVVKALLFGEACAAVPLFKKRYLD